MRKLLVGYLILITACLSPSAGQTAASTRVPESRPTATHQTPPTPVTVTQTSAPVPTFSPTPFPAYFTEEFDSTLEQWTSFLTSRDEASPRVDLQNGALTLDFSAPNTWYYALHNAHEYPTVHIETKFNSAGNRPVSLGLVCSYSEEDGWVEFNITSDGTYNVLVGKWLAAGIAQYTPIASDGSEYLSSSKTDYEIGLTCRQDILQLYINGKLFRNLDFSRYEFRPGKIGVAAAVFENAPVTAYFEWLRVSEPAE